MHRDVGAQLKRAQIPAGAVGVVDRNQRTGRVDRSGDGGQIAPTSIVMEPGVSTHTSLVFGLIWAAMPAPISGSYCSTVTFIRLSSPLASVLTGSYTLAGIST